VQLDGADELTELAEAFDESQRRIRAQMGELERREQALRDFVADTTHDVMLPLTVLQGYLTSLERQTGAGEPLSSEILHGALEECHYLASMVQNLGAAARLEAGEALSSLSNVDLNALVGRVIARHRRIADQRGLALEFAVPEAPIALWADVTLLEQALSNLVHNAVRYGHRGGHVAVILERRDGGHAFSLRVLDDGPGIPAHHLARITERGYRGDRARSRSTQAEGLGLGLHIVRDVAERHGLTLDLRAGEEGGLVAELQGPLGEGSSGAAT
jgi:signal transduction histidine kinase